MYLYKFNMNTTILVIDIPIYFKINILTTTGETVRLE